MKTKDVRAEISFSEHGPTLLERLQTILNSRAEEAPAPWSRSE